MLVQLYMLILIRFNQYYSIWLDKFKTDNKPYVKFTYDSGNIITNSKKTLKEILSETMNAVDDLRELEKQTKVDFEK